MPARQAVKRFDPILRRQEKGTAFGPSVALDVLRELAARADSIEGPQDIDLSVGLFDAVETATPTKGLGYDILVNTPYVACIMFHDRSALLAVNQGSKNGDRLWVMPEPLQVASEIQDKETGHTVVLDDCRTTFAGKANFRVREKRPMGKEASFKHLLKREGHDMETYVERLVEGVHRLGEDLGRDYGFGELHTLPPALMVPVIGADMESFLELQALFADARDYAARAGCADPFSMVMHGFDGLKDLSAATVDHVEITAPVGDAVWLGDRMGAAAASLLNTERGLEVLRSVLQPTMSAGVLRALVARRKEAQAGSGIMMESVWPPRPDRIANLMKTYGVKDPHPDAEVEPSLESAPAPN